VDQQEYLKMVAQEYRRIMMIIISLLMLGGYVIVVTMSGTRTTLPRININPPG
jgi:hypothetical protein